MEPVTWMMLAMAIISAGSAAAQAQQSRGVAEYNAQVGRNKAAQEEEAARENLRRQREENEVILSRQRAMRAKSGVSIETGSSLLVAAETAARLEQQAVEQAARGQQASEAFLSQARMDVFTGKQEMQAGYFKAGESLMRGVGQAAAYEIKARE